MANFAILRIQKLKSIYSVRRSFLHSYREQKTPNANANLLGKNELFGATSTAQALAKFRGRLPDKLRKNGVLCVEHLITASPEWFEGKSVSEQRKYFSESISWLTERWGADNVICGGVHHDETTPHMFVYIVPRDEKSGRLNCRKWLGEKSALSEMQTDFYKSVGEKNGLERGIKGSKAAHKTLKKYYSEINVAQSAVPPETLKRADFVKAAAGLDSPKITALTKLAALAPSAMNFAKSTKLAADIAARKIATTAKKLADLEGKYSAVEEVAIRAADEAKQSKLREQSLSAEVELLRASQELDKRRISTYRQIAEGNKLKNTAQKIVKNELKHGENI